MSLLTECLVRQRRMSLLCVFTGSVIKVQTLYQLWTDSRKQATTYTTVKARISRMMSEKFDSPMEVDAPTTNVPLDTPTTPPTTPPEVLKSYPKDQKEKSDKTVTNTQLYVSVDSKKWPIVYSADYNISFLGLEKLHPFDAGKWGRIFEFLKEANMLREDTIVKPVEASEQDLMVVHSRNYINSLKWSMNVAGITEVPPVALLPNFIVQRKVLRPFRYQTGGTILAGKLAMERGWAINIGGGFHHCSSERGGGFCAYADITLAIKFLFQKVEGVSKVMIIDLDAHQGNGHERDFMDDSRVYIMDVYNRGIYPHDGYAKRAIKRKVELNHLTDDVDYLDQVKKHVEGALNEFQPDIIVYNAGTDILDGDPLGNLSVSAQGIIERDEIVFKQARRRNIPILMLTSGGYMKSTSKIIADSVLNLKKKRLIVCEEAEAYTKQQNAGNTDSSA